MADEIKCPLCGSSMLKVGDEEPVCPWCGRGLDPYYLETPEVVQQ